MFRLTAAVLSTLRIAIASASADGVLTNYSGYLVDFYCYSLCDVGGTAVDASNVITGPEEHTLHCLRDIPQCRDGYFLAGKDSSGEYRIKFLLDDTSQQAALDLVKSFEVGSDRDHQGFAVTATGYHNGDGVMMGASFDTCFEGPHCDGVCIGSCTTPADLDYTLPAGRFFLIGHVVCMCLSWGCLLPLGVVWAHYLRQSTYKPKGVPVWFYGHRMLQSIGVVLQLLGLVFIIIWKKSAHFKLPHEIIGLVVVLLGTLQPLNAQLRHLKAVGHPGPDAGPFRKAWEFLHKGSGYVAVFLGIVNVIYGPVHAANMRFSPALSIVAGIWVGLSVGSLIIATIYFQVKQTMGNLATPVADANGVAPAEMGAKTS